ncbi:MAG: hypothetical protein SGPRY_001830, partial [Prymnesium sp.]
VGTLSSVELAEARQASNDCSGWLSRLSILLGSSVGGGSTTRRLAVDPIGSFSEQTKGALRSLQQEMAELNHTFQAAYPGRKTMQETRRGEGGQVSAHRASR